MRLVPGMKMDDAVAALKAHLAKRGYGDIEVNVSGGYDATSTPVDARLIQAQLALLRRNGLDPLLWPRLAGDRKSVVSGKSGSVRVDPGGRRINKKKK